MNTLRRIVYQLRRWLFLRTVRPCRRCDGTGAELVGRYSCDGVCVVTCRACAGDGWLPK